MEQCVLQHEAFQFKHGIIYCNATYDSFLCWPPTEADSTVYQKCPAVRLSDSTQLAYRRCGERGLWLGRRNNESSPMGWTNYTPCFPTEVQDIFGKVYSEESRAQQMFDIAQNTRNMETIGFTVSLISLLISLFIFFHFKSLQNARTRIHCHLIIAMIMQMIIRLIVYLDQALLRDRDPKGLKGLHNTPYICEGSYILLEYGVSAMFCWMLIEGLYLHNIVTDNALRECASFRTYIIFGWTTPLLTTSIWSIVTGFRYRKNNVLQCWYGYNYRFEYWICQAPRVSVVIINIIFLLNILRVLINKLNQTENSEFTKMHKAVRATLFLLPLLGITNVLNMIEPPLDGPVWQFALWSYTTHFLRSFQGFFIAIIYCFMNAEVRQVLKKSYTDWKDMKADERRMKKSFRAANRHLEENPTVSSKSFRWFRSVFKNHCNATDIESNDAALCQMYKDSKVLDRLPTIRFDAETNTTDV